MVMNGVLGQIGLGAVSRPLDESNSDRSSESAMRRSSSVFDLTKVQELTLSMSRSSSAVSDPHTAMVEPCSGKLPLIDLTNDSIKGSPASSFGELSDFFDCDSDVVMQNIVNHMSAFTLLDGLTVSYDDIDLFVHSAGFHKTMSGANSNCWMRSVWYALLAQTPSQQLVESIIDQCGEDFRECAEAFALLTSYAKQDASQVFTHPHLGMAHLQDESCLRFPDEPRDRRVTDAETLMVEITQALLLSQGISAQEIDRYVLGNRFGGDTYIQALVNVLKAELLMLSEVTREVTILAPKESQLAQELELAIALGKAEDSHARIRDIIVDHFAQSPVLLHMGEGKNDYSQGRHFEVFIPHKAMGGFRR